MTPPCTDDCSRSSPCSPPSLLSGRARLVAHQASRRLRPGGSTSSSRTAAIIDGTGAAWFYGDVGIVGDRIARVAPRGALHAAAAQAADRRARSRRRARLHRHPERSDGNFLAGDGRSVSKITQGITTEILGEGVDAGAAERGDASRGGIRDRRPRADTRTSPAPHGFAAWLDAMERARHRRRTSARSSARRRFACTRRAKRMGAPTPAELDTMRAVVRRAMEDGAFGIGSRAHLSAGQLRDDRRADRDGEGDVAVRRRLHHAHALRGRSAARGDRRSDPIGTEGGVPVEIYHLKAAGTRNWPKGRAGDREDRLGARARGWTSRPTCTRTPPAAPACPRALPPWASENGKLIENLAKPGDARAAFDAEMLNAHTEWENLCQLATPENVLMSGSTPAGERTVHGQAARPRSRRSMSKDWPDAAMDLLIAERQRIGTVYFLMSEDNVKLQLAAAVDEVRHRRRRRRIPTARGHAHPSASVRQLPEIMGQYVRDEHVHPARGRGAEGDVGGGDAAVDSRAAGHSARELLRGHRGLRSGDDRRACDVRATRTSCRRV